MPQCSNCGADVAADAEYCQGCGAAFGDATGRDWNVKRGVGVGVLVAVFFAFLVPLSGLLLEAAILLAIPAGVLAGVLTAFYSSP